jgi:hypothetical protein
MTTWVRKRFSDVEHARTTVLTAALAIGSLGFVIAMAALLAH